MNIFWNRREYHNLLQNHQIYRLHKNQNLICYFSFDFKEINQINKLSFHLYVILKFDYCDYNL